MDAKFAPANRFPGAEDFGDGLMDGEFRVAGTGDDTELEIDDFCLPKAKFGFSQAKADVEHETQMVLLGGIKCQVADDFVFFADDVAGD